MYYTELQIIRALLPTAPGNGPQYFVVEAKSGLKYEFGNTIQSQVIRWEHGAALDDQQGL